MITNVENFTLELTNNPGYPQLLFKVLINNTLPIFTFVIFLSPL